MFRILYHVAFWSFFVLLFWYQNPEASASDHAAWLLILVIAAAVVYINLYALLPRFFITKKYTRYLIALVIVLLAGAAALHFFIGPASKSLRVPFLQHVINLFVFVLITSSLRFLSESQRKQSRLLKLENQKLKAELDLIKSQVNPHFLFNTLNNLYGLILVNENQQAGEVALKLSDLMRYLLESTKLSRVALEQEIKFIRDYLSLEKIRLSHKPDIRFDVVGSVSGIMIEPMLLISLVENSFKHGLHTVSEGSLAHFTLTVQQQQLFFEAVNSLGTPRTDDKPSGNGLINLRKHLELAYPGRHALQIGNKEGRFTVLLQITL